MRIKSFLLAAVLVGAAWIGSGCGSYDCGSENESKELLRQVPVPANRAAPGETTPLAGGGIRRQSYSLDPDGDFTFSRSLEIPIAHMGADFSDIDRQTAETFGVEPFAGVLVRHVKRRGPAATAGLKSDDVILSYTGKSVLSAERLEYLIEESKPGEKVELALVRNKEDLKVTVELGEEKRIESGKAIRQKLPILDDRNRTGLKFAELTPETRPVVLGPQVTDGGLLVVDVLPGGPGFFAGVKPRDFLVKVGDQPISGLSDYSRLVEAQEPGNQVTFMLVREGVPAEANVTLDSNADSSGGFSIPAVVKYERHPSHREFWLAMGFLFNYESCYSVKERNGAAENVSSRNWGTIVDLIKYKGNSRGEKRLTLLWWIPLWRSGS